MNERPYPLSAAIRHGDVVVTEGAAICAYLADAFPQAGLAPAPTDRLRGTYYRWLFFAAGPRLRSFRQEFWAVKKFVDVRDVEPHILDALVDGAEYASSEALRAVSPRSIPR